MLKEVRHRLNIFSNKVSSYLLTNNIKIFAEALKPYPINAKIQLNRPNNKFQVATVEIEK
jgi:hypothetical protein